jgi:putative PEP-CTERM system TPR-repeat lipoprotein
MIDRRESRHRPRIRFLWALAALLLAGCGAVLSPQYRLQRAARELHAGEWQKAGVDLHAVLLKEPRNIQAWLLLTRLGLDAADPQGAVAALHHALVAGAHGPAAELLQARVWLATGHAKAFLSALDHHQITLTEPERSLLLAKAEVQAGEAAQAAATLTPVLAAQPKLTAARDGLAEALVREDHLAAGMRQLKQAAQMDPASPEPLLLQGRIEAWLGQFARAERTTEASLKRMPRAEPVLHRITALIILTESRLALAQVTAAAKSQAALAALEPTAPETQLLAARIQLARHDLQGAIDQLERLVVDAPKFVQARMLLGAALLQHGDLELAQQQLEQVIEQTPDDIEARKLLADVQLKLGEPRSALDVLTPALSAPAFDPQLLSLYGAAAQRAGNSHTLVHVLAGVVHAHPHDQAAKLNLAAVYLASGQAQQALPLLEQVPDSGSLRRDRMLIAALAAVRGTPAANVEVGRLIQAHPKDPGVLTLAADYDAAHGEIPQARTLLKQALALTPTDLGVQIGLARIDEVRGHLGAAERRLRTALSDDPHALPVRLALAAVLVRTRQYSAAHSVLKTAGRHGGPPVEFALARVALAQGDLKSAEAELDRAIASAPHHRGLTEQAGLLLMQAGQYSAALARFSKATQRAPDDAADWLNSARAQLALNQPLAARASLRRAVKLQPDWLPVVGTLALLDVREKDAPAALDRVAALVKREPDNPGALALEGVVEAAAGQTDAAVTDLDSAQRLHPSALVAVQLYHVELTAHRAHPERPLAQWLARAPADWPVRELLGGYELMHHALPQAMVQYRQVLAVQPNNVVALNNLAWALSEVGAHGAVAMAMRAHRLAPKSPSVDDTLGWALARSGRSAQALAYLASATRLDPHDPDMAYHYAYALAHSGHKGQARRVLTQLLRSQAAFPARRAAQRLLAGLKQA